MSFRVVLWITGTSPQVKKTCSNHLEIVTEMSLHILSNWSVKLAVS